MPETMMRDALALLIATTTLFASYGAGAVALGGTAGRMRRTARLTLLLLFVAALLVGGEAAAIARSEAGATFAQWATFAALIAAPAMAAVSAAVRMAKFAAKLDMAAALQPSRTLRKAAADKKLVLPIHALTLGSIVYAAVTVFPSVRGSLSQLALFAGGVLAVAVLLAVRQHVKHKRIHRIDGTAAVYRLKRMLLLGTAMLVLPACLIHAAAGRTAAPSAYPAVIEVDTDGPGQEGRPSSANPEAKTMGWFPAGAGEPGIDPVSSIVR
ncbi:hypothetical protein ACFFSY_30660 [Paenibacillus aurantiacus]|uniref:Uncharacterized protein n=1 Tax=Paenibacillus aurantiacus TaxID=1936118 RepID=A0ABV5KYM3_9BACL